MAKKRDIFSLIKADHRKVDGLFAKLEKTTERAANTRKKWYAELRRELTLHTEAEEKALYPSLKENEKTEEIGFESVEEHDIVKFLLGKLDDTPCDAKEWTAQITALQEAVEHHVEEEEDEMFPKMRKAFSKEELEEFAQGFEAIKAQAKSGRSEAA